jgi:DNA replication licensing factor MCM7
LPAALLSRFDLIFILLDTRDYEKDLQLARHIGEVHKNKNSSASRSEISGKILRNYIALAKGYEPKISEDLSNLIIERYVQRRQYYADRTKQG